MAVVIQVEGLVFEYATRRALHGIDVTVPAGSVTALVGPNGAGKTTFLRCLAALERPFSGRAIIDGCDTAQDPRAVHRKLGYLPDFFGMHDELTVGQTLFHAARMKAMPVGAARQAAQRAAERVGLADRMSARVGELSRGLRQRCAIGQTIVHEPAVLLLDEPAAGLDPDARKSLSDLVLALQAQGLTIMVSSHILAELEDYSSAMLVMEDGRLRTGGLIEVRNSSRISIRLRLARGEGDARLVDTLTRSGVETSKITCLPDGAQFEIGPEPMLQAAILTDLVRYGFAVAEYTAQAQTLEATYHAGRTGPVQFGERS